MTDLSQGYSRDYLKAVSSTKRNSPFCGDTNYATRRQRLIDSSRRLPSFPNSWRLVQSC